MSHLIILRAADCYVMLIGPGGKLRGEINPRGNGTSPSLAISIFIRNSGRAFPLRYRDAYITLIIRSIERAVLFPSRTMAQRQAAKRLASRVSSRANRDLLG